MWRCSIHTLGAANVATPHRAAKLPHRHDGKGEAAYSVLSSGLTAEPLSSLSLSSTTAVCSTAELRLNVVSRLVVQSGSGRDDERHSGV